MNKIDRWKFPHAYHDEYLEGYNSSPHDECPYPSSRIGKYCAWMGGKFDRYGSTGGKKMASITEKIALLEAAAKEANNYTNMPMEVDPRDILELISRIHVLQEKKDALARENRAMKRCAIKYLEWLGVTHVSLEQALCDDMYSQEMCGDAALTLEDHND